MEKGTMCITQYMSIFAAGRLQGKKRTIVRFCRRKNTKTSGNLSAQAATQLPPGKAHTGLVSCPDSGGDCDTSVCSKGSTDAASRKQKTWFLGSD